MTSRAPASRVDAIHTAAEYSRFPIEARLGRLQQTPEELAQAISGKTDAELSRRPDAHNWAAKEIVCHLRDVEELFQIRFHTVVALEEPPILVLGASAEDLALLRSLSPTEWRRGGIHLSRGRLSLAEGSPVWRRTMTTTSPSSAGRSKAGREAVPKRSDSRYCHPRSC